MKLKLFTALFSILFLLNISILAQRKTDSIEYIAVADSKIFCDLGKQNLCLQVKKFYETNWNIFSGQIENFNYEPGYFYLLKIRKQTYTSFDNISVKISLKKILSREKSVRNKSGATDSSFYGTKWILDKIGGNKVNTDRAFITFDAEKNRFGGKGSCNLMSGNLKVEGSIIDMSNIFSTKMFCHDTSKVENAFFAKLEEANRFEIKGEMLHLYKDETLLLELKAE